MDTYVLGYRLVAVGLVAYWAIRLVIAMRKPAEGFRVPESERLPIRLTRNRWLAICVIGMTAGVGVLAFSYVYFGDNG